MISRTADLLLALAFPQPCHSCGNKVTERKYGIACSACWSETRFFTAADPICGKCGLPLDSGRPHAAQCRQCDDLLFDRAIACGVYENALASTVLNLKKVPVVPAVVVTQIARTVERTNVRNVDCIIPIPLSAGRRVERGYNQAEIVARIISKAVGVSVDAHSLTRKTHTPMHRAGMDKRAREATVKNAFEVVRPKLIAGRSILLVDDVLTSGATASSCARVLKKNGSGEVNLFTLARAVTFY